MKLDRLAFLKAATLCRPAMIDKSIIPELTFLFSDGKSLTAYDDTIGIQVPFESPFKGGVKGGLLHGMLEASRAAEVELDQDKEGEVLLKAGRFRLRLALMPLERAPYRLPGTAKAKSFTPTMGFYEALKACEICLSKAATIPDQLGVALERRESLQFYATDTVLLASAQMKPNSEQWPVKKRLILPARFVEQLLKFSAELPTLTFTENEVLAETKKGVKIFARLVHSPKPHDFQRMLDAEMASVQMFSLPQRLEPMLTRALVLFQGEDESKVYIRLHTADGVLRVSALTKFEALTDSTKLEEIPKEGQTAISPKRLLRVLPFVNRLGFTPNGLILSGKNVVYLICAFQAT